MIHHRVTKNTKEEIVSELHFVLFVLFVEKDPFDLAPARLCVVLIEAGELDVRPIR